MACRNFHPSESSAFCRLLFRRSLPLLLLGAVVAWVALTEGLRGKLLGLAVVAGMLLILQCVGFGIREYKDPYSCDFDEGELVLHYYGARTKRIQVGEIEGVTSVSGRLFPRDYLFFFVLSVRDQSRIYVPPYLLAQSTATRLREMAEMKESTHKPQPTTNG